MTDNDLIQAYGFCQCSDDGSCDGCPFNKGKDDASCLKELRAATYELMNRLKSETESLKEINKSIVKSSAKNKEKIQIRARHQFVRKLKTMLQKPEFPWDDFYVTETDIESLLKQMGRKKGTRKNDSKTNIESN